MKYNKKHLYVIPALALAMSLSSPLQYIKADTSVVPVTDQANSNEEMLTSISVYKGKITEIINRAGTQFVRVASDNQNEGEIDFIINDNGVLVDSTGFIDLQDLQVDDDVTVHYLMPQVTTMIYPAQLQAAVLVKNTTGIGSVYVGLFETDMLSAKGDLRLNVNRDNPILNTSNKAYTGNLEDKVLVVFSSMQTASLPAQTSPNKIIVLDIDKSQLLEEGVLNPTEPETEPLPAPVIKPISEIKPEDLPNMRFFLNNKAVEAPEAYVNKNGTIMLPLRAIAESLGYTVGWNEKESEVTLGVARTLTIGKDYYVVGRMAPISLGAAPQIKNDLTFVPINFFKEVLQVELNVIDNNFNFSIESVKEK